MKINPCRNQLKKILFSSLVMMTAAGFLAGCAIKPRPLTQMERDAAVMENRALMYQKQDPIDTPITLEEAMARSIKYNLHHKLKQMEEALANHKITTAQFEMLPKLTASAGYISRDRVYASSSMSVLTNTESLEPSTSQDKERDTSDLTFSWNLLDFGVSYYQARQQADRALMASERRRKTIQNLMVKVRGAFWNACGAQQLTRQIEELLTESEKALDHARQVQRERLRPALEMLLYQKKLLEIAKRLEALRDELTAAKPMLASLMNIPPGQDFKLAVPGNLIVPEVKISLEEMEEYALYHRPDLIESEYQKRISATETRKAILKLLPGIQLKSGTHYDSNSFLYFQRWTDGSAHITWNLLDLLSGPSRIKTAKALEEVSRSQALALSMAVLSQVHISNIQYHARLNQFRRAQTLNQLGDQIYKQIQKEKSSNKRSWLEGIQTGLDLLMSKLSKYKAYAQLQIAYGQIESTIGIDPLPETVASYAVDDLKEEIRKKLNLLDSTIQARKTNQETVKK